jgi:NADPH2:quinone reductase
MGRDASIIGFTLWNTPENDLTTIHAALFAALEGGVARPVVGKKFPLAEAARAHEEVLKPGSYGKIVLLP